MKRIYRTIDKSIQSSNWDDFYREVWKKKGVKGKKIKVEWQEINSLGWEVCFSTMTISK